jgi:hypothetical protein
MSRIRKNDGVLTWQSSPQNSLPTLKPAPTGNLPGIFPDTQLQLRQSLPSMRIKVRINMRNRPRTRKHLANSSPNLEGWANFLCRN